MKIFPEFLISAVIFQLTFSCHSYTISIEINYFMISIEDLNQFKKILSSNKIPAESKLGFSYMGGRVKDHLGRSYV